MESHRKQAGLRVAQLREQRGWTQAELAYEAGISEKTVNRFENGRHDGRRTTIRALAKALKVPEVGITGEPPAPLALGADPADPAARLVRIEQKLDELLALVKQRVDPVGLGVLGDLGRQEPQSPAAQEPAETRSRRRRAS